MSLPARDDEDVTLLDLLDRLIDRGVVLTGDLTISVADVDLILLSLNLLLASVERVQQLRADVDLDDLVSAQRPEGGIHVQRRI
jgi:gas vesicle structural protein